MLQSAAPRIVVIHGTGRLFTLFTCAVDLFTVNVKSFVGVANCMNLLTSVPQPKHRVFAK